VGVGEHVTQVVDAAPSSLAKQLPEVQRLAAGQRARPRDRLDGSRPAEHRFDQARGARNRQRRRLQPYERALGGEHRVRPPRSRRPGGDDEGERQLSRAPRGQSQEPQGQAVSPLSIVEQQRERPLVGQLDDQPPQRVHDLIAAGAGPARLPWVR
jgi:hypothetical protein